ncbi:GNAT family N-acetyltransferase [Caulobacter segnis]|uniref:GNAT family N-acetyltransferase n=1 Tax=Caulobacter segnis TaxID=88688 RepID=UPI00240FCE69|nr:GNAT family N-acetyltransferase [Caulobacter segnis]MDG2523528.1 GNAT family N-acetyltransferase [Caulobacter segnis]
MSEAPLDRPAWHALNGRQASYAIPAGRAVRYASDAALFAACRDDSEASHADLGRIIREAGAGVLLQAAATPPLPGLNVEKQGECVQMVAASLTSATPPRPIEPAVRLTDADAPQMLALATLTEPGPFFAQTHRLGEFWGVKDGDGRLLAMAGERMRLDGHTEVSGVCTHPDHRGHGHGAMLTWLVAARILARGETPFLHSYTANAGAVALYEALGFRPRALMTATFLRAV